MVIRNLRYYDLKAWSLDGMTPAVAMKLRNWTPEPDPISRTIRLESMKSSEIVKCSEKKKQEQFSGTAIFI